MRATPRSLLVALIAVVGAVLAVPATAAADEPAVGYDISYPQCEGQLPDPQAFAVVGVNGGRPAGANPCLADQLSWAWQSSGSGPSPAALYLNTANPGGPSDNNGTWPESGTTPYGLCEGGNTAACAWEYGQERARTSVTAFFTPAALAAEVDPNPSHYTWWLDVESANVWQYGSAAAQARNRAVLEGVVGYLQQHGARVGVYGLAGELPQIVGTVSPKSPLHPLDSWLAGGRSLGDAAAACAGPPLLAGGNVRMVQFVSGGIDYDVACS
jgi:hypothetical protein